MNSGKNKTEDVSNMDELGEEGTSSVAPFDMKEGEKALEEIKPFLVRIAASKIRQQRVSVPQAVGTGLAYARSYEQDRDLFEASLTHKAFDAAAFDNMEQRAKGFWHADIMLRKAERPAAFAFG
jgi:hypothetical protein